MRVVTLVPWRPSDDRRRWLYDMVRPSLEALGWPIYEGDSAGEWARVAAVNAAAAKAGTWDLALIADSDTIPDPVSIRRAVTWVADAGGGVRPHMERRMLTREGSLVMVQRGPGALEPKHFGKQFAGGGLDVVRRDAWDLIGGMDESFVGWGYEDSALHLALLSTSSWDRLPGTAWHLWHSGAGNRPKPKSVQMYHALLREHRDAINAWAADKGLKSPTEVF